MSTSQTPGTIVALTRLTKAVYRRSTDELLGMPLKGYMALTQLHRQERVSQQALGETMHLDPNNLVLLLNSLESEGFVQRRRDPEDRRRHIVVLTPAGERALERAEAAMESIEDDALRALSPSERATLRALLGKALAGLGPPAADVEDAGAAPAAPAAR